MAVARLHAHQQDGPQDPGSHGVHDDPERQGMGAGPAGSRLDPTRMPKRQLLLWVLCCLPGTALANCDEHLTVEAWADDSGRIAGLEASVAACPHDYDEYRVGVSYFAYDDLYEGVSGSARLRAGDVLSVFAGAGLLVGKAEEEADDDGVD